MVTKELYGKERERSRGQIKTCRKKQHVKIDDMKEMPDLICGKTAVGGNYNSTHDSMRMGEILGLTWDCVDFDNGIIDVQKTLCYLPNDGVASYSFHAPKTRAGKRQIPMTKEVRDILLQQKTRKERIAVRHNPRVGMENLVFCSKTNNPINEANIGGAIRYLVDKINKENPDFDFKPFTPHGLRHTFATRAIAKGMRPKTLQKILGHNSLQMTMDLYCHVETDTLREEMALIGEVV